MEENRIIPIKQAEDWFLSQLWQSNRSSNETMRILKTLKRYVRCYNRDIFYSIEIINEKTIRFKPLNDLADDCLLIVSIFAKHILELNRRRAAPSVNWYRNVGAESFKRLGYYDIAEDYDYWVDFISEHIFA